MHGASTEEEVQKDIEFFFPKEKTLAVIKPNAMSHKGKGRERERERERERDRQTDRQKNRQTESESKQHTIYALPPEAIIDKVKQCGFSVTLSKEQQLTKEMAEQLYSEHQGKEFFNELTEFMTRYILFLVVTLAHTFSLSHSHSQAGRAWI